MTQTWGRTDTAGTWPPPKPLWTIATLIVALLSAIAIQAYRYTAIWTPLQRSYVAPYLRSAMMGGLGFTATGHYRLLQVVDRTGHRLALDEEVQPVAATTGETTFALTDAAVRVGDRQLVWQEASYNHAKLHTFLGRWIYHCRTSDDRQESRRSPGAVEGATTAALAYAARESQS